MDALRPAAVAGSWYPSHASRLAAAVDGYLADADVESMPRLRAVIAPHAGLVYSGPVAAFAYRAARETPYRTVVLVGPSHFVSFHGVALWPRGAWHTPFGAVAVDEDVAAAIAEMAPAEIVERADAHAREHSLELQLPFVARLWPAARIVPLVMGHQTRATAFALGDALARVLGDHPDVLLVASSDLSHYQNAQRATAMDEVVMRHVAALDADGLMRALEDEPRHACGGGPIVSILAAASRLGATHARVLRYADSGDVSGDKSSVVGYLAAAIW